MRGTSRGVQWTIPGLTADVWEYLLIVFNGVLGTELDRLALYFNGVLYTTGKAAITSVPAITQNGVGIDFVFGARRGSDDHFAGRLDEPAVWSASLDAAAATAVWNGGVADDLSALAVPPVHGWRGDGDTFSTLADQFGSNPGTMTNMVAGDLVTTDAP